MSPHNKGGVKAWYLGGSLYGHWCALGCRVYGQPVSNSGAKVLSTRWWLGGAVRGMKLDSLFQLRGQQQQVANLLGVLCCVGISLQGASSLIP